MNEKINDEKFNKDILENEYYQNLTDFNDKIRTKFKISFLFLILEVFIPIILLWCLFSRDFNFSFKIPFSLNIGLTFAEFLVSFLITTVFYLLKWHKTDQFTYVFALQFALLAFYISGFWWINHIFFRFLLAFGLLLIGLLIGTFISSIFYNFKLKKMY